MSHKFSLDCQQSIDDEIISSFNFRSFHIYFTSFHIDFILFHLSSSFFISFHIDFILFHLISHHFTLISSYFTSFRFDFILFHPISHHFTLISYLFHLILWSQASKFSMIWNEQKISRKFWNCTWTNLKTTIKKMIYF